MSVSCRSYTYVVWETRCIFYSHRQSPLTVKSDKRWHFGGFTNGIYAVCIVFQRTSSEKHSSYTMLAEKRLNGRVRKAVRSQIYYEQLCHLLLNSHGFNHGIHPVLTFTRLNYGLYFFRACSRSQCKHCKQDYRTNVSHG